MSVHDSREWTRMPGESLRQEQVSRRPVDVGHAAVTQAVEVVPPVESSPFLPPREPPLGGSR